MVLRRVQRHRLQGRAAPAHPLGARRLRPLFVAAPAGPLRRRRAAHPATAVLLYLQRFATPAVVLAGFFGLAMVGMSRPASDLQLQAGVGRDRPRLWIVQVALFIFAILPDPAEGGRRRRRGGQAHADDHRHHPSAACCDDVPHDLAPRRPRHLIPSATASVGSMHPIERLRYVARASGAPQGVLVQETATALASFGSDPQGLVTACRRIVWRQPTSGAAGVVLRPGADRRRRVQRDLGGGRAGAGRPHRGRAGPRPPRERDGHGAGLARRDRRGAAPARRRRGAGRRHRRRGVGLRQPAVALRRRGHRRAPGRAWARRWRRAACCCSSRRPSGPTSSWPSAAPGRRPPWPTTPASRCGSWPASGGCCRDACGTGCAVGSSPTTPGTPTTSSSRSTWSTASSAPAGAEPVADALRRIDCPVAPELFKGDVF